MVGLFSSSIGAFFHLFFFINTQEIPDGRSILGLWYLYCNSMVSLWMRICCNYVAPIPALCHWGRGDGHSNNALKRGMHGTHGLAFKTVCILHALSVFVTPGTVGPC